MILIADSGSTKTDWVLVPSESESDSALQSTRFSTQGINPFHQDQETIGAILREEVLTQLRADGVSSVSFYGSGVRPEFESLMVESLQQVFTYAKVVEAHSDMLGAARALCLHNYGIASILGTGSNSCLYDGERIVQNTPALGYILGDEGSGAVLGRLFLNAIYKGILSDKIKTDFESETGLTMASVIERVYRQPLANRFLASLSAFIHRHLDDEGVSGIVVRNFEDFFRRNIAPYDRRDLPISFVGSIAWYYQPQLREAAARQGFQVGTVMKSPATGLVEYHRG